MTDANLPAAVATILLAGCAATTPAPKPDLMAFQTFARYPLGHEGRHTGFLHLMRGQFECPKHQRRAVWYQFGGYIAIGCWRVQDGKVWARFEDGDDHEIAPVGDVNFGPEA